MLSVDNVYDDIKFFYDENKDAESLFKREYAERYVRRLAWQGHSDDELQDMWHIVSLVIVYAYYSEMPGLYTLSVYDYQDIIHGYARELEGMPTDDDDEYGYVPDEAMANHVIDTIKEFYQFVERYTDDDSNDGCAELMEEVRASVYADDGFFDMPEEREPDEFYTSLAHMEEVTPEAMQELNHMLDALMARIDEFFHQPELKHDIDRAILMFIGPEIGTEDSPVDENQPEFWMGFWDFFLFDYHLLDSDKTPLRYFFEAERKNLSSSECDIIRDLLRSRFTVFNIVESDGEYVTCHNMFTDELIDLPMPESDIFPADFTNGIFFGHIHSRGVMLLNYISYLPASENLRQRMKEEVLRQLRLFQFQSPAATLDDFFTRNAGAVRHTLRLMAAAPRLSVIPVRPLPAPIAPDEALYKEYAQLLTELDRSAHCFGYSSYTATLLQKMLIDYIAVSGDRLEAERLQLAIITALDLEFAALNGIDLSALPDLEGIFGAERDDVQVYRSKLRQTLQLVDFDPRYISEEGFIRAMYNCDGVR